jgi:prepilin-type processing-associated H-X9-DG protein
MPSMDAPDVIDIVVDRPAMQLRLEFDDGVEGAIGLMELRLNCPCATCRAARQRGVAPWPTHGSTATLELTGAQLVGAWGLGVAWADGHATGIYAFESLYAWIVDGHPSLNPDSGLGA